MMTPADDDDDNDDGDDADGDAAAAVDESIATTSDRRQAGDAAEHMLTKRDARHAS